MFLYLTAVLSLFILILYVNFKKRYGFWKKLNVPYIHPTFPTGNVSDFLQSSIHFSYVIEKLYRKLRQNGATDYGGIYFFGNPVFLVLSPEFAKTVLVKDFQYFMDRGIYFNEKVDVLSANIFFLRGSKWKTLREKVSPTFTSGKIKQMFFLILDIGHRFQDYLMPFGNVKADIDIRDVLARFMTDVIASCAFGLDTDCINDPNSQFRKMGRKMIHFSKSKALKLIFASTFQKQATFLGIRWNDVDVSDFFINVVKDTIRYRKESGTRRNDFMQLLIDMMKDESKEKTFDDGKVTLTLEEIAAQAFVFLFAGFETSSTTMVFCLHLLAHHQDIQDQARESIKKNLAKYDGVWCFDAIMEMEFIEQIIEETLRLFPPVSDIHRWTSRDYKLPNGFVIPKEIAVIIPALAFARDPNLFPDPMKFDPSRFTQEAKAQRHPFSSIPFGEGNRRCIGMRFGMIQMILGLSLLLDKFRFSVCKKTTNPIEIDTVNLFHGPAGEVFLNIETLK
ncbi:CLUMA_CG004812, isoform A [Clunio marinus]|uniref:CLUMA_CG004812, isoform A n=1 Tax=Clunio marinus TaxID=568069 RepID=A0A1J1HUT3_9DIPT|nr:CLUMA_CG004812, isoform A [Clunio marinus]